MSLRDEVVTNSTTLLFRLSIAGVFLFLPMQKLLLIKPNVNSVGNIDFNYCVNQHPCFSLLVSNPSHNKSVDSDFILAVGVMSSQDKIIPSSSFHFGHIAYDYKNQIENLSSKNFDGVKFPDSHFFQPRYVLKSSGENMEVNYHNEFEDEKSVKKIAKKIFNSKHIEVKKNYTPIKIKSRFSKNEYIETVKKIKAHIQRGDIYEINFCMEFYAEDTEIDPAEVFYKLNQISCAPFSCFYKLDDKYLMCASPERFIKKEGNKLISQPIKGTARRGKTVEEDEAIKHQLLHDKKELSENVMIVDLVRNDVSRIAKKGTVNVDELFGIYTFKQVHQMISTVSCELQRGISFEEIIKSTFPMGSMTGAPKIKAMELIEKYECTKRGLFSGSVGYITPEGDFDFNVVIRSILYNSTKKYLSFHAGSAITFNSDPEKEYEECMLKAKAMFEVLGN